MKEYQGGNVYNKYESRNPVEKYLMSCFFKGLSEWTACFQGRVADVGCGEGYIVRFLQQQTQGILLGMDLYPQVLATAKRSSPGVEFIAASIDRTPLKDKSLDTVLCLEILEHLERPEKALQEMARVSRKHIILSVPWEPFWRLANMVRFKYWSSLGNTPGHLQHWTKRSFKKFLTQFSPKNIEIKRRGLWMMAKITLN